MVEIACCPFSYKILYKEATPYSDSRQEPRDKNTMQGGVSLTELTSKSKVNNFYVYLTPPIGSQGKWLRDLHVQNDCNVGWKVAYSIAFNCTAPTEPSTLSSYIGGLPLMIFCRESILYHQINVAPVNKKQRLLPIFS